ncbi:MAG: DinB family protein [Saprospiraceae bacterium]
MTQQELLDLLETDLRELLADVRSKIAVLPLEKLHQRPAPESWSILETVAHLNRYADDYLPRLHRAIHLAKARRWAPADEVRYTGRGRRLLRRADSSNGKAFKSPKRYDFLNQPLGQDVVKALIINSEQLLRVVQEAQKTDLNRPTIPKANAWFGRYTLGNLLEFLVLHKKKHVSRILSHI